MKKRAYIALLCMLLLAAAVGCTSNSVSPVTTTVTTTLTPEVVPVTLPPVTLTQETVTMTPPTVTVVKPPVVTVTETLIPEPITIPWEVIYLDYKVVEENNYWWKFSWSLTIRNRDVNYPIILDGRLKYVDGDGFTLEDDSLWNLYIPANGEQQFSDYSLIDYPLSRNVKNLTIELELSD